MHSYSYYEQFDLDEELEGLADLPDIRNMPHQGKVNHPNKSKSKPENDAKSAIAEVIFPEERQEDFNYTYKASRHEHGWLLSSLANFYDGRWINDVLMLVRGGKEASVYLCSADQSNRLTPPVLAAKVYRPRQFRNLRNDHLYREGRSNVDIEGKTVLDDRMLHAMRKRTQYGLELLHTSWIGHEFKTLQILHAAGVDLPEPYVSDNNAILMEYIGTPETPAPTLNTVSLERDEAQILFERVLNNIDLMLANHRIHGDLSAFNILYWESQIHLIDFPQAIDPDENQNAYRIFARDVKRICEYFARQGIVSDPTRLSQELWRSHGYRLQPDIHPGLLNEEDELDRRYWSNLKES